MAPLVMVSTVVMVRLPLLAISSFWLVLPKLLMLVFVVMVLAISRSEPEMLAIARVRPLARLLLCRSSVPPFAVIVPLPLRLHGDVAGAGQHCARADVDAIGIGQNRAGTVELNRAGGDVLGGR